MMNQINSDPETKENSSKIFGKRIFNFIKELELFIVLVIMGVALIALLGLSFDSKTIQITGLLSYLAIALLFLVFYSVATTRTVNDSIVYKLKQVVKRFLDIVFAFLMLIFLSPLFLLFAVAVGSESPGPIFFNTVRLGQFGKPIRLLKLRTMYLAPKEGFTRVGKFLRQTHLNELPQLWNVLIGEMSLVGPSPRRLSDFGEALDSEVKTLTVRPGITGLSQTSGASDKDLSGLDLEYIENWSLSLDIKILFKTILFAFQDGKST